MHTHTHTHIYRPREKCLVISSHIVSHIMCWWDEGEARPVDVYVCVCPQVAVTQCMPHPPPARPLPPQSVLSPRLNKVKAVGLGGWQRSRSATCRPRLRSGAEVARDRTWVPARRPASGQQCAPAPALRVTEWSWGRRPRRPWPCSPSARTPATAAAVAGWAAQCGRRRWAQPRARAASRAQRGVWTFLWRTSPRGGSRCGASPLSGHGCRAWHGKWGAWATTGTSRQRTTAWWPAPTLWAPTALGRRPAPSCPAGTPAASLPPSPSLPLPTAHLLPTGWGRSLRPPMADVHTAAATRSLFLDFQSAAVPRPMTAPREAGQGAGPAPPRSPCCQPPPLRHRWWTAPSCLVSQP